ncbi:MAG: Fic family protein [Alphaproteobacteria bacterium]|nr:Fic family protein [Alphaproteobacteria bacterium]
MDTFSFDEYVKQQKELDKVERAYAWKTAIGLQAVDGLKTSDYLRQTAVQNIEGNITLDEAQQLINSYYATNRKKTDSSRTEEADKVSSRITELLSETAFSFTPNQYISIHKKLFKDIYEHAGKIRTYNITKKEWVLNGETVIYGGASEILPTLEYDFSTEKNFSYKNKTVYEIIQHLANFVSGLWQIHCFCEGNTRTTAVFFIKYLNTLGFKVGNDIFEKHAWYFRNALVRANYTNLKKGIHSTIYFLELFLKNLILNEQNELKNRKMHIDFSNEKQDIQPKKQDIHSEKQDIENTKQDIQNHFSKHILLQIDKLRTEFGNNQIFGRIQVANVLNITSSPTSALIKKLLENKVIIPVKGFGKGKYKFFQ